MTLHSILSSSVYLKLFLVVNVNHTKFSCHFALAAETKQES